MLPKIFHVGKDDTQFNDIEIGDESVSGGKCIAKMLIVVTKEEFNPMQIHVAASADNEHYTIENFEKIWNEGKNQHIDTLKRFKKQKEKNEN